MSEKESAGNSTYLQVFFSLSKFHFIFHSIWYAKRLAPREAREQKKYAFADDDSAIQLDIIIQSPMNHRIRFNWNSNSMMTRSMEQNEANRWPETRRKKWIFFVREKFFEIVMRLVTWSVRLYVTHCHFSRNKNIRKRLASAFADDWNSVRKRARVRWCTYYETDEIYIAHRPCRRIQFNVVVVVVGGVYFGAILGSICWANWQRVRISATTSSSSTFAYASCVLWYCVNYCVSVVIVG